MKEQVQNTFLRIFINYIIRILPKNYLSDQFINIFSPSTSDDDKRSMKFIRLNADANKFATKVFIFPEFYLLPIKGMDFEINRNIQYIAEKFECLIFILYYVKNAECHQSWEIAVS